VGGGAGAGAEDDALAVYVHWPFCESKCPYCDFNSHVAEGVDDGRWRSALLAELDHFAQGLEGRRVASIFFGGGTPSLMAPETAAAVIGRVKSLWPAAEDLEVTLEANPSSVEAGRFRAFLDAGVNRVSIGVQSLRPESLQFLGRRHSAAEALSAIAAAAKTFERFSFDLIYGLPGQTADAWRRELAEAVKMAGGHVSAYQLAIEPGTPFHRDGVQAAPEGLGADLYAITQEVLEKAGLRAYEISNHARPGAECRHNLDIWQGAEYVGIGPGAHGRLRARLRDGAATEAVYQVHAPGRWLAGRNQNLLRGVHRQTDRSARHEDERVRCRS